MRSFFTTLALALISTWTLAQTPTWSGSVANLIYNNCATCHHAGSIGPFPLMSYADAHANRYAIKAAVQSGFMPPWHPDTTYQEYAHERFLTAAEVQTIASWVDGLAPEGNPAAAPPAPVFPNGALLPGHDLQLRMPAYASQATTEDDYICVAIDPGLSVAKKIRAFEVLPGNREIVHHVLVYIDDVNTYVPDSIYRDCVGPTTGRLIGAYIPGSSPIIFPSADALKMGVTLSPGNRIVFAMHYPEGSLGMLDSTAINLHFYPDGETGVRDLLAQALIQDWNFCIDPETVEEVFVRFPPQVGIPGEYSVLSTFPHCHLLGKYWEVYAVSLDNQDTIPMIKINNYDFDWQGFYFFKHIIKLPSLYRIEAKCRYDNTSANLTNPNSPPLQVCDGHNTSDEMMLVYFHFLEYQTGDELFNMDSLLQLPVQVRPGVVGEALARITPYPNPSSGIVTLDYYVPVAAQVEIEVLDMEGRILRHVWKGKQAPGQYHAKWDGWQDQGGPVSAGVYFVRLRNGDQVVTTRLVRQ